MKISVTCHIILHNLVFRKNDIIIIVFFKPMHHVTARKFTFKNQLLGYNLMENKVSNLLLKDGIEFAKQLKICYNN